MGFPNRRTAPLYRPLYRRRYDLTRHLDGQPLQLMMKDRRSGTYLYKLLMWHQALLPAAERHAAAQRAQQRASSARLAAAGRENA